jgi:hypothetical protein
MAYKSKICKAFFFGQTPAPFAPNHPPNFPRSQVASPIQINGLPIAAFDLAELTRTVPRMALSWRCVVGCDGCIRCCRLLPCASKPEWPQRPYADIREVLNTRRVDLYQHGSIGFCECRPPGYTGKTPRAPVPLANRTRAWLHAEYRRRR